MRPTPIEDEIAAQMPGERIVVGPPGNNLDSPIAPVEAMAQPLSGGMAFSMRLVLEDRELQDLQEGGAVWLTTFGSVVPFYVHTGP